MGVMVGIGLTVLLVPLLTFLLLGGDTGAEGKKFYLIETRAKNTKPSPGSLNRAFVDHRDDLRTRGIKLPPGSHNRALNAKIDPFLLKKKAKPKIDNSHNATGLLKENGPASSAEYGSEYQEAGGEYDGYDEYHTPYDEQDEAYDVDDQHHDGSEAAPQQGSDHDDEEEKRRNIMRWFGGSWG